MTIQHPNILQLDIAGNPCRWIDYQTAAYYYAKDLIAWTVGEGGYTIFGGNNRITANRSFMDLNSIIAVRGEMGNKHLFTVPALSNRALFLRDQKICAYCANEFTSDHLTRDHIHPTSRNGRNIWTNVVSACGPCNKRKNDKTPEEAGMKLHYVPYAPNRAEYLILVGRNVLVDQMDFLKSRIPQESRIHKPFVSNQKKMK